MRALTLGAALLCLAGCLSNPELDLDEADRARFTPSGDRLIMRGEIDRGSAADLTAALQANPGIRVLVLADVPGATGESAAVNMGRIVRREGLATQVPAGGRVYSGGVDLFLAGTRRSAAPGAVLGVHAWSDGDFEATEYRRGSWYHEPLRGYVAQMLGDDGFYWFSIHAAPSHSIHIMSRSEMRRYGVITDG